MPLPELEIRHQAEDSRVVLAVAGEVDMATVGGLRDALERAADAGTDIWLDLTEVEFMDSTGLTALVTCHQAMDHGVRRFTIICPASGPVRRALEVSGLHEVLRVRSSRDDAADD